MEDKANFVLFLKQLSDELKPKGLMLTTEGTVSKPLISRGN